jgi:tetratricopeptide (TPR) repeat protein
MTLVTDDSAGKTVALRLRILDDEHRRFETLEFPEPDLEVMASRAAEAIISRTNPYLYTVYRYERDRDVRRALARAEEIWVSAAHDRTQASMALALSGRILLEEGDTESALRKLRSAVQTDPQLAMAQINLGVALAQTGRTEEAIAAFQKAIGHGSARAVATARLNWARLLRRQNRREQAIAQLRKAADIDRMYAPPHNEIGEMLAEAGKCGDAADEFRNAVAANPDYLLAYENWADVLKAQQRYDESRFSIRKIIELDPRRDVTKQLASAPRTRCEAH